MFLRTLLREEAAGICSVLCPGIPPVFELLSEWQVLTTGG